jgi:hypothetical protein
MNEKEFNNMFRFSLYQENTLMCEKVFSADQFNPFTRYSIDIREILPKAITRIQKVLSKRSYETQFSNELDFFQHNQKMISKYPQEWRKEMYYNPTPIVQQIEDKTIRGVECKIGFYINDKPIVERMFYVDGFNPVAKFSADMVNAVVDVADNIFNLIKRNDIKNMWDDYDLINIKGLSINQIRELSPAKREEMLRRLRKN